MDECFLSAIRQSGQILKALVTTKKHRNEKPLSSILNLYIQGDQKSLCAWWSQNRNLQLMFKLPPVSLQAFIDTPNRVPEDRVQYSTVHIPNVFCDGRFHFINCVGIVRIHCFFITPQRKKNLAEKYRQGQGDTRITLTPHVITNCNYARWLKLFKILYFWRVLCTLIVRCTETFWSPCISVLFCSLLWTALFVSGKSITSLYHGGFFSSIFKVLIFFLCNVYSIRTRTQTHTKNTHTNVRGRVCVSEKYMLSWIEVMYWQFRFGKRALTLTRQTALLGWTPALRYEVYKTKWRIRAWHSSNAR